MQKGASLSNLNFGFLFGEGGDQIVDHVHNNHY